MGFYLKGYVHMYALTYASNRQAFYYYHYYYYHLLVIYNFETENNVLRGNGMFDERMHRLFGERDATYIISLYIFFFWKIFYFYVHAHQVDTG